jgi:hypothetical protein
LVEWYSWLSDNLNPHLYFALEGSLFLKKWKGLTRFFILIYYTYTIGTGI